MDEKAFDDLTRSLASRTNRRRLVRAAVLGLAGAGGARILPTEAARRGYSSTVSICNPTGTGGYTRMSVAAALLPSYLEAGAVLDNGCCADGDCAGDECSTGVCDPFTGSCQTTPVTNDTACTPDGPIDLCRSEYTCQNGICTPGTGTICVTLYGGCLELIGCNSATGQCDYENAPDGTRCNRGDGCAQGTCASGVCQDPLPRACPSDACRTCRYDPCGDHCFCTYTGCVGDPDCQSGTCDPQIGCVFESINEGGSCSAVSGGLCHDGQCVA